MSKWHTRCVHTCSSTQPKEFLMKAVCVIGGVLLLVGGFLLGVHAAYCPVFQKWTCPFVAQQPACSGCDCCNNGGCDGGCCGTCPNHVHCPALRDPSHKCPALHPELKKCGCSEGCKCVDCKCTADKKCNPNCKCNKTAKACPGGCGPDGKASPPPAK
jgi:hypothetical protein